MTDLKSEYDTDEIPQVDLSKTALKVSDFYAACIQINMYLFENVVLTMQMARIAFG